MYVHVYEVTYKYEHVCTCYIHVHTYTDMYIHVHVYLLMYVHGTYIHVHDYISLYVHCTYMYINVNICLDTVQTRLCMFTTTLHFPSRQNLPDQPCDAGGESQLCSGAAPSELPSSWHQSFQSTDHPGAACHTQTATATVSPRTHCFQACHPLLQCHSCPKNTGKPDL
jgi:hypothetical protein